MLEEILFKNFRESCVTKSCNPISLLSVVSKSFRSFQVIGLFIHLRNEFFSDSQYDIELWIFFLVVADRLDVVFTLSDSREL